MGADKKRRGLIKSVLIAPVVTTAVAAGERLYGAPASISGAPEMLAESEKFFLPLIDSGFPLEAVFDLSKVSSMIEKVLTDENEAESFFSSPRHYFESNGLSASDSTFVDESVAVLFALSSDGVRKALEEKDYNSLFSQMEKYGVFEPRGPSAITSKIDEILMSRYDEIKEAIENQKENFLSEDQREKFLEILRVSGSSATEEDLSILSNLLNGEGGALISGCSAMAACFLGIALAAYLYVVAAVAVVFSVGAAIHVSAATRVAISISGNQRPFSSEIPPFVGKFIKLDPSALRNIKRSYKISRITKDGGLYFHALREALKEEVSAVIGALDRLGLVKFHAGGAELAIEAISRYTFKAMGIDEGCAHDI